MILVTARFADAVMLRTEIANQVGAQGIWGPFAIRDISIFMDDKAIFLGSLAEPIKTTLRIIYRFDPLLSMTVSAA